MFVCLFLRVCWCDSVCVRTFVLAFINAFVLACMCVLVYV